MLNLRQLSRLMVKDMVFFLFQGAYTSGLGVCPGPVQYVSMISNHLLESRKLHQDNCCGEAIPFNTNGGKKETRPVWRILPTAKPRFGDQLPGQHMGGVRPEKFTPRYGTFGSKSPKIAIRKQRRGKPHPTIAYILLF